MARSRAQTEYTRLKDVIAAATNNALWSRAVTLAVREEATAWDVKGSPLEQKPANEEPARVRMRAQQRLSLQAISATTGNDTVAENGFYGFGDCCGGPSGKEGPDDALWERIQRTPGAQPAHNVKPRTDFSARCMAPGENSCQGGCGVDDYNRPVFCSKGQVCRIEQVSPTVSWTNLNTHQTMHSENKCYDVTECPARETVLATHPKVRSEVWDDPGCTAGCPMERCGDEAGVPCCVRKEDLSAKQCPSRATVMVTRKAKRWKLWNDPYCTTGCTLDDCGAEVPCCVKAHAYDAHRKVSLTSISTRPQLHADSTDSLWSSLAISHIVIRCSLSSCPW